MAFQIHVHNDDGIQVDISGDFDIISASEVKTKVLEAYQNAPGDIVFHFENLQYLDSTGIGALISIYKNVKPNGHSITIRAARENVKKLFRITKLDQDFILED
ncbi:MAG: STAS domain-containing protein [Peptoniphilaceae bacterium]|nr:STAS domain-containing protein [Peptoniphilaceae bacterium]MDY6085314.1 STAS domain-containing protein [Peptoniphilaceae bacterium]